MIAAVIAVALIAVIVLVVVVVNVGRRPQSAIAVARQLATAPDADFAAMKRAADAGELLAADRLAAAMLGHFAQVTLAPPEADSVQGGLEQQLRSIERGLAEQSLPSA